MSTHKAEMQRSRKWGCILPWAADQGKKGRWAMIGMHNWNATWNCVNKRNISYFCQRNFFVGRTSQNHWVGAAEMQKCRTCRTVEEEYAQTSMSLLWLLSYFQAQIPLQSIPATRSTWAWPTRVVVLGQDQDYFMFTNKDQNMVTKFSTISSLSIIKL